MVDLEEFKKKLTDKGYKIIDVVKRKKDIVIITSKGKDTFYFILDT